MGNTQFSRRAGTAVCRYQNAHQFAAGLLKRLFPCGRTSALLTTGVFGILYGSATSSARSNIDDRKPARSQIIAIDVIPVPHGRYRQLIGSFSIHDLRVAGSEAEHPVSSRAVVGHGSSKGQTLFPPSTPAQQAAVSSRLKGLRAVRCVSRQSAIRGTDLRSTPVPCRRGWRLAADDRVVRDMERLNRIYERRGRTSIYGRIGAGWLRASGGRRSMGSPWANSASVDLATVRQAQGRRRVHFVGFNEYRVISINFDARFQLQAPALATTAHRFSSACAGTTPASQATPSITRRPPAMRVHENRYRQIPERQRDRELDRRVVRQPPSARCRSETAARGKTHRPE